MKEAIAAMLSGSGLTFNQKKFELFIFKSSFKSKNRTFQLILWQHAYKKRRILIRPSVKQSSDSTPFSSHQRMHMGTKT